MKAIALLVGLLVVGALYWLQEDYNRSMEICQLEHSFDTCFYSLNH